MLETRVLRYFLAVAREGSITAAAQSLHVTQPTLSRQLMDLEDELGQKLFVRGAHHVVLTPEGILLRKRASEILELVGKTESEFSSMGKNIAGDVYIGSGETDAMNRIAAVIREIRMDYPDVHFHIYSGNAEDVMDRLDKGMLDFGILIQPVDIAKYNALNLPEKDVWGVAMRRDCPLAKKKRITKDDLLGYPLIFSRQVAQSSPVKNPCIDWFGGNYKKLNIVASYNLIYNGAILVKSGLGVAVTLDKLLNVTVHSDLVFRPLEPRLESGLDMVWKKYQVFSAAAELFLSRLQAQLQK